MDIVVEAFQRGQFARSRSDLNEAIIHYTNALEVFHSTVGSGFDPPFWATILYARAESYLLSKRYHLVVSDIKQALNACPFPIFDLVSFTTFFYTTLIPCPLINLYWRSQKRTEVQCIFSGAWPQSRE